MSEIKMDRRTAERLLNNQPCNIRVDLEHTQLFLTTATGIGNDKVYIPHEKIFVPLEDISAIEYTDRFGTTSYIPIDW